MIVSTDPAIITSAAERGLAELASAQQLTDRVVGAVTDPETFNVQYILVPPSGGLGSGGELFVLKMGEPASGLCSPLQDLVTRSAVLSGERAQLSPALGDLFQAPGLAVQALQIAHQISRQISELVARLGQPIAVSREALVPVIVAFDIALFLVAYKVLTDTSTSSVFMPCSDALRAAYSIARAPPASSSGPARA